MARRERDDRGSVSVFYIVAITGITAIFGLVVDGGRELQAREQASSAAEQAARAGAQQIKVSTSVRGDRAVANPAQAKNAAQLYLSAAGVTGTATLSNAGTVITVTTSVTYTPVFLGAFGVGPSTVTDSAQARLAVGVTGEEAP